MASLVGMLYGEFEFALDVRIKGWMNIAKTSVTIVLFATSFFITSSIERCWAYAGMK